MQFDKITLMKLSEELKWRNQVKDITFNDITWLDEPKTFYLGTDCGSSDSLQIGNLAVQMLARRLKKHGWKAVLLVGGATSLIGDPGGKDSERDLISREVIQKNVAGIASQVKNLFNGMDFELVDNYDWFKDIGYLDFLRDVGKTFSMTELLQRDFIASRLGEGNSGISYAEFSYNLIQGYDFWHLFKNHGVVLQIGGSDQWGNMLSGIPLIRKKENKEAHAMSMPLVINKTSGAKFGKSEGGSIWLDPEKTSIFQFYQFWINVDDDSVEDYIKIYTELEKPEVDRIMAEQKKTPGQRPAQKRLALEVTAIVHGAEKAESVKNVSDALFGEKNYKDLGPNEYIELERELPVIKAKDGALLVDILVDGKLASSKTEAKRFLETSAVYVNGSQIPMSKTSLGNEDLNHDYIVVRRGKNESILVTLK